MPVNKVVISFNGQRPKSQKLYSLTLYCLFIKVLK